MNVPAEPLPSALLDALIWNEGAVASPVSGARVADPQARSCFAWPAMTGVTTLIAIRNAAPGARRSRGFIRDLQVHDGRQSNRRLGVGARPHIGDSTDAPFASIPS